MPPTHVAPSLALDTHIFGATILVNILIYTVFQRINAPGVEAQNNPLILSDCNEPPGYPNIECSKFEWDQFSSF